MDKPWGLMLSEISQRRTNTAWPHLPMESKNTELIETESRMEVAPHSRGQWGRKYVGQREQTFKYKMNNS